MRLLSQSVSLFTREWIEIPTSPVRLYTSAVSLFTREWIEIRMQSQRLRLPPSPSLRGSGLKFFEGFLYQLRYTSPSLRGSGLKSTDVKEAYIVWNVSLFTREWIEIPAFILWAVCRTVSLFTREWIEIINEYAVHYQQLGVSLFTREWIEILITPFSSVPNKSLPLYEGVD